MPLRILEPQAAVQERIASNLRGPAAPAMAKANALGGAAPVLGLAAPHPMFNLSLDALDAADWVKRAEMTGWRYFVTSDAAVVALAEAASTSPTGPVGGALTNEGPFVLGSEEALAFSERQDEISKGSYVLGLLRVPALYVVALWLRSEDRPATRDRFVPVSPAPAPLTANVLMKPKAFITALRQLKASKRGPVEDDSASN